MKKQRELLFLTEMDQGDTYLKTLFVFHTKYRTEEEIARPYIDTIDLYEELGGKHGNVIEDNQLIDVTF
jgi:hypothetical protein